MGFPLGRPQGQGFFKNPRSSAWLTLIALVVILAIGLFHKPLSTYNSQPPTKTVSQAWQEQAQKQQAQPTQTSATVGATSSPSSPNLPEAGQEKTQPLPSPLASPTPTFVILMQEASSIIPDDRPTPKASPATHAPAATTAQAVNPSQTVSPAQAPQPAPDTPSLVKVDPAPHSILQAQWPPTDQVNESTFLRRIPSMLLMLAIVCLIIWAGMRLVIPFYNKMSGKFSFSGHKQEKMVEIEERHALGAGKYVVLLKAGKRHILVGITDQCINTLAEIAQEDYADSTALATQPTGSQSDSGESSLPSSDPTCPEGEGSPKDADTTPKERNLISEVFAKHLDSLPFPKLPS